MEFKALIQKVATLDLWPHCHPLCHPPPFSITMEMNSWAKKWEQAKSKAFHRAPKRKWMKLIHHWARDPESKPEAEQARERDGLREKRLLHAGSYAIWKRKAREVRGNIVHLQNLQILPRKMLVLGAGLVSSAPFPGQNFLGKDYQEKDRNFRGEGTNALNLSKSLKDGPLMESKKYN